MCEKLVKQIYHISEQSGKNEIAVITNNLKFHGTIFKDNEHDFKHEGTLTLKNVKMWHRILPTEFITVQRVSDHNLFVLGESNEMMYDKKSKEYKIAEPIFQKFLDKAKIKNSGIIFKNIVINNYFRKYNKNLSSYIY